LTVLELNGLPYISINLERIMRKMETSDMLPAFFLPFEDGTVPDDPLAGIFRQELGELMSEYRRLTAYIEGISDSWMRSVFEWRFVERRTFREIGVKCSMDAETLKKTVYSYIHRNPEGYVTCRDLADRWGVNVNTVNAYCRRGCIPGAVKGATGKLWLIPEETQQPVYIPKHYQPPIPAGFVTAKEIANAVGVEAGWITKKCRRGDYPGARKIGHKQWIIPQKNVNACKNGKKQP